MALKFFDKLSQNLIELLNDKEEYNVIIEVENKEKSFTAHSNVLKFRSSYFQRELENIQPNENNIKIIIKSSISAQIFNVILQYIYGGIVDLENCETRFIYDLIKMALKFFDKLSQNLIELLNDKEEYNVIIEVENKEKSFTAHSNVLKFRSSYFQRELENIQPNENNIKIIIKSSISAQIFNVILQYIYGGIVDLENCETRFIYDLMLVADEFEFEELSNKLETLLIETKGSWLRTHFSLIYHFIFSRTNFKKLENFCNDIVVKYPNLIFDTDDFTSLEESALVSLLKRNDLQMEEVKIWDYVIKWGIARTSALPTNLDDWTKENFLTLKTTLQQCLPHIRYFHLSSIEVVDKIKPFKKIMDKQLWDDINQHLLIPDRPVISTILPSRTILNRELPPRIEEPRKSLSDIISEEHAAEISTWIDRRETAYNLANIPYEFELILRGTRDGFAPQTFWDICHGHVGTVVLVKVKGTDEIIGGYNPLPWDNRNTKGKRMKTKDSFIFSLKDGNMENSILSRIQRTKYAIANVSKEYQKEFGPYFGDFYMHSRKSNFGLDAGCGCFCRNKSIYYEKPIRASTFPEYFSIIDYEVFKIVKKTTLNFFDKFLNDK
ncbi:hypothetical protein Glove_177g130 [Diversispora epigaea]|uniref:BTB domain-containing protein n=1 Tax=Diversispora epigaea TaxID=1348612 RepID=A0A397IX71_9GLOM|nr:hypothetical protein Glove_177g130 [Diversispora epigaea]